MYLKFYGLKERPFQIPPDPRYFFLSSKHKTALNYLKYGLLNNIGFIVITGEIGTGKTILIKKLLSQLKLTKETITAIISNTNVEPIEFLQMLLQELGINCSENKTKADLLNKLNHSLIEQYSYKKKVVLIADEAQNFPFSVLEEIRMISNLQTEKDFLIQIILVGQPPLKNKLLHPSLEQLLQRVSLSYHLLPLSQEETKDYIKHRLRLAKAQNTHIFSRGALEAIFKYSQGVPRVINMLCDAALVYGFADEAHTITAEMIDNVTKELYPYKLAMQPHGLERPEQAKEVDTSVVEGPHSPSLDGFDARLTNLEKAVYDLQQRGIILLDKMTSVLEMIRADSARDSDKSTELQEIHKECQNIRHQIQKIYQWELGTEIEIARIRKHLNKESWIKKLLK